jgi:ubiquitin-protein ligase
MPDSKLIGFLRKSHAAGMALAAASDRVVLIPEAGELPQKYLAEFHCRGLVRVASSVVEANFFRVGIVFPDDYLKTKPNSMRVLSWLQPEQGIWHPNVRAPLICLNLRMETDLVSIVIALYEMITYQKFATADPLDPAAAEFARANMSRFPIDSRPLRRRAIAIEEISTGGPS